jgi:glycosyltransferase involved in cell wall biosynthesis
LAGLRGNDEAAVYATIKWLSRLELSIITINLNNASGLRSTLESIACQHWKDFEVIVVDGKSKDNSAEVIGQFQSFITCFIHEPDHGIYDAQNKGLRAARGKYLLFLNSGDTLSSPDTLNEVFQHDPQESIVYGEANLVKNQVVVEKQSFPRLSLDILANGTICHQCIFFRKELFTDYGIYDTNYKYVGDYEFLMRCIIAKKCSFRFLPVEVCNYDMSGITTALQTRTQIEEERRLVQKKYFGSIEQNTVKRNALLENELSRLYKSKWFRLYFWLKKFSIFTILIKAADKVISK